MPKSIPLGPNYTEEELAKKRAVVLDFLSKQKKGVIKKKTTAESKPAVILPNKSQSSKVITLPKMERPVLATPTPAPISVAPISQFLGEKNKNTSVDAVEVDFLEDVKREKMQKQEDVPAKPLGGTGKAMPEKKADGAAGLRKIAKSSIPAALKESGPEKIPRVDLLEDINNEARQGAGSFQWAGVAAVLIMLVFSLYFLTCLFFFTFKPHSELSRSVAKLVPVPGLISSYGFIEFYQYYDLKQSLLANGVAAGQIADAATAAGVEWQILEQLASYYQLAPAKSAVSLLNELGKAVVSDKEINARAFSTIRKMKQQIAGGKSFEEVATEHGTNVARGFFSSDDASQKFGPGFASLRDGAISNIIVSSDGFYIVQRVGTNGGVIEIKYVLVKPKTLADIVDSKLSQAKAINFVR